VFALLRRRNFALLWFSGLISVAGDWVLDIALPFYVFERTGSTVATAGMIVANLTPHVLLGSVAGVFVDRWNRKRVLVATNLLQAAMVALLLLVPGGGWLGIVYLVAVAQSCAAAFALPAEGALLPSLVPDRDLVAANAMNSLNNRAARLVGAPAGGALLAAFGLEIVVLLDVASFLAAALILAPIPDPRRAADRGSAEEAARSRWAAFWHEWVAGLRLVATERGIAILFFVFGLMTFGGTMLDPLRVAWVRDVLGEGPDVYAFLTTTHAVAGLAGTLVVGMFGARAGPHQLIGVSGLVVAAALFLQYNIPVVTLAFGMSVISGVTSVVSNVGVETLAQRAVAEDYRGRVFGSLQATIFLLSLLGAMTGGALAEIVGVVAMLNVATALIAVSALVALRAFAPRRMAPAAAAPP
jgi:MFS family permease